MTALVRHLADFGDRPAVATATEELTYRDLAHRVADSAAILGNRRRLILMETRNELGTLVPYLGALARRHVVLPVPPGRDTADIVATYRPDTVITGDGGVEFLAEPSADALHPELSLLMSTSGSTGSPKLVRLSRENLISNADAIGKYLGIDENDRAATTLPMSYCYGLSVVHSHLRRGAGLILTDHSVVDDEFWELFLRHRGTSFAGVPYTFDLLDRVGFGEMDLPDLRYITQAGGRLAPQRVRRYADLGARRGWQLFVMYGATEATARMAYLPAELAAARPSSIGRPVPGGSFAIEPLDDWPDPGVGELVYRGPNVMLGYAGQRADLALGRTVDELRTGDIARRDPDGLYQVIGRSGRFVKMWGLRIDLQRIETVLSEQGVTAFCAAVDSDDEDRLALAVTDEHDPGEIRRLAARAAGLPSAAVWVAALPELPLLPSGKPDYAAVRGAARRAAEPAAGSNDIRRLFVEVLHVSEAEITADSTFLRLGGTSLNYVAMSIRLERMLGYLPPDWQQLPVRELERLATLPGRNRRWFSASLETGVALRAVAIILIVGSHAGAFQLWGGAHILLGLAGYNFGRFCLRAVPRAERVRHLRITIASIAVPSIAWVAIALLITDDYHLSNLLLANKILGPFDSMTAGRLWFVEVLVYVLIGLTLLLAVPTIDRLERRVPFTFAAVFLAAGVALRYDVLGLRLGEQAMFTYLAFWFFAAGWAAAKAQNNWQRFAVTAVVVVCTAGYFEEGSRQLLVLGGLILLFWLPAVRCPEPLPALAGLIAEASLYTYLVHFQVYPLFAGHPVVGVVAAITAGVLIARAVTEARRWLRGGSTVGGLLDDGVRRVGHEDRPVTVLTRLPDQP
ncbi:AMP-binding protein [Mycolicibacterium komossense]|uniref:AMP-binding protein n=1 Tax=Mycolicibacterium komossense TaxID=1779 RepID=A0ABT3C8Q5_9MYCO|nr:AMP-binding protein [Mycolicibacterium komossense]MCV7225842.1 AMP-binding protein [Mycolicibacterium komossense]